MNLCRFLRWKSWYHHESFTPDELAAVYAHNEVPYTCLKTCHPWGPDDDVAAPERCGPDRACFRASPKLVRPVS